MSMYVTTHTLYTIHAVTAVGGDNAEGHTYMPLTPSGAAVCVTVWLCNTVRHDPVKLVCVLSGQKSYMLITH